MANPPRNKKTSTRTTGALALPSKARKLLAEMLVAGASFEEAAGVASERQQVAVDPRSVEKLFHSSPDIQRKRIRRQLQTAQRLRKALSGGLKSPEAELAEGVLFTGIVALNQRGFMI